MMDTHTILHLLRNGWGHSEERQREARLAAADLIEQLTREKQAASRQTADPSA